jgi:hypothetical protein
VFFALLPKEAPMVLRIVAEHYWSVTVCNLAKADDSEVEAHENLGFGKLSERYSQHSYDADMEPEQTCHLTCRASFGMTICCSLVGNFF